ncbi:MAG: transposase, partial [Oceanisphaera sp.]|nr:transposase [Oceanisphaera sp.]
MKNSTFPTEIPSLLRNLLTLLAAHRPAFRQERTYQRAVALVFGELFSFARHTVTQALLALGLTDADWSAWYRLFSRPRFVEETLANCLLAETLAHAPADQPYVVVPDGVQLPRSSRTMPGTSWLKAPRTPVFRVGIHRAQRFVHGAWLTPLEEGYSRAIPLRFVPAFPEKAVPAETPPCREWTAGLQFVSWVRQQLDRLGRAGQTILLLADGRYDVLDFWQGLPDRTVAAIRCAKNRVLYELPIRRPGPGRPPQYGPRAPTPAAWLRQRQGFRTTTVTVRGRPRRMRYRVEGPYLRDGNPNQPLVLLVVGGQTYWVGKRQPKRKYRKPAFYLLSAVP